MRIMKFGGSSLADAASVRKVIAIIRDNVSLNGEISVVVSALSGVTNSLADICRMIPSDPAGCEQIITDIENRHLSMAAELTPVGMHPSVMAEIITMCNQLSEIVKGASLVGEVTARTRDKILGFGEQLSAWLVCNILRIEFSELIYTDARLLIKTDSSFGNAKVLFGQSNKLIMDYYNANKGLKVVTGFIASTPEGETTTLGRNGSDYTASILGAALDADLIEIWTDTDGVLTADPTLVREARNIEQLSYNEAMELSHFGAKVIFPASLQPAMEKSIPLLVKNTFNPSHKGTFVCDKPFSDNGFIKGITSLRNVSLLNIEGSGMVGVAGVAARMFTALSAERISVILISQASSEHSICIALPDLDADKAVVILKDTFSKELELGLISSVRCEPELSIVAVVGENMRHMPGVAARVFAPLGRNGINIKAISQGSSELNISFVIAENDLKKALRILHQSLFKNEMRQLNLFIAGTGLVGGRLLDMIPEHNSFLKSQNIELRVCGIINSRKMLTGIEIPDIGNWRRDIESIAEKADLDLYVNKMLKRNFENCVLVDVTGATEPADYYLKLLSSNISVVAANKIANSGDFETYGKLREAAARRRVSYHYETNVGAGLPVINVIRNLISGGDKIRRIDAILSGTLNWLLSEYSGTIRFSELVIRARELGYTEPDPRLDLSGTDVTRKCLILSRECGIEMDMADIETESLIPPGTGSADLQHFLRELSESESYYHDKYSEAASSGKKLRYIASIAEGRAKVGLQMVDESHAFYNLKGSGNCIILTTDYYRESPMIITGPGAGANVTAAGLLADIVRVAEEMRI
jgi:aspartokinase/homoserine dehydrogenase 1